MPLGMITYLPLKSHFSIESSDFNPYLASHLDLIADQIELSLELVDTEHKPYYGDGRSLDILAKTEDDEYVAIECQYSNADSSHCWRLQAYACAIKAKYVVLICEGIDTFNKAVFERLNETSEEVYYYVLVAKLVSIDNSNPALLFETIVSPDFELVKTGQEESAEKLFWVGFKEYFIEHNAHSLIPLNARNDDHINLCSLKEDRWFSAIAKKNSIAVRIAVLQEKHPEAVIKLKAIVAHSKYRTEVKEGAYYQITWHYSQSAFDNPSNAYPVLTEMANEMYASIVVPCLQDKYI